MRTTLPTNGRRFFRHAVPAPPKPPKPLKPNHKNKVVMTELKNGQMTLTTSAMHAVRVSGHKGGSMAQARGTAHRWNSETASKAAHCYWKRVKNGRYSGKRLGYPSKRARPFLNHAELRWKHQYREDVLPEWQHTYYSHGNWFAAEIDMVPRPISERRALTRLGYLHEKGRTPVSTKVVKTLVKQKGRGRITVVEEGQTMK